MKAQSRSSSTPTKRSKRGAEKGARRWTKAEVLRELAGLGDPRVRAKLEYFGIHGANAHGVSAPVLHKFAKHIGKDHELAHQLWDSGIHEAKVLAALIGESEKVTAAEMDRWAADFDSWDVVDGACRYLYSDAEPAWEKIYSWSKRTEEYVKRAAFSLAAYLSYRDKEAKDADFVEFLRVIEREAHDERNFVKKAVNWALRQIGKRNLKLNKHAIGAAERIRAQGSSCARWIAADALRELKSDAVQKRLRRKAQ
jgi:3-methyladenine DNA glycosylase AlkD